MVPISSNTSKGLVYTIRTVINSSHGRPELSILQVGQRECGLASAIRTTPLVGEEILLGVGAVLQNIALAGLFARLDRCNFLTNRNQSITEAIKFLEILGFSRFNHESSVNGPGHSGSMEPVILETLSNIDSFNAGTLLESPKVEDKLVGAARVAVSIQNLVMRSQARGHIISVQQCNFSSMSQTATAYDTD